MKLLQIIHRCPAGTRPIAVAAAEAPAFTTALPNDKIPVAPFVLYYQYDPETQQMGTVRTPWVKRNHRKAFWQTGYTLVNSIAIDGSSEKSAVRLSLTYTKNEWIMPNTGDRKSVV